MNRIIENRRDFLKHASIAAAFPFLLNCRGNTLAQRSEQDIINFLRANAISSNGCSWCGAKDVPQNVSSRTILANNAEKAGRLVVSGTVFEKDGKTPAPGVLIYLYHTDAEGIYGRNGEHRHGRYRGWLLSDAKGRYEFETIRPASYPNTTFAAHIHMTLTGRNFKEDWIDSILFEGDRFITERERTSQKGGFNPVLRLENGADGILAAYETSN